MSYPEPNELAALLDRASQRTGSPDQMPAIALHFAAALLCGGITEPSVRLILLLDALPIVELLSAAALRLDQQAAAGDERAREAAQHIHDAGRILTK